MNIPWLATYFDGDGGVEAAGAGAGGGALGGMIPLSER